MQLVARKRLQKKSIQTFELPILKVLLLFFLCDEQCVRRLQACRPESQGSSRLLPPVDIPAAIMPLLKLHPLINSSLTVFLPISMRQSSTPVRTVCRGSVTLLRSFLPRRLQPRLEIW